MGYCDHFKIPLPKLIENYRWKHFMQMFLKAAYSALSRYTMTSLRLASCKCKIRCFLANLQSCGMKTMISFQSISVGSEGPLVLAAALHGQLHVHQLACSRHLALES